MSVLDDLKAMEKQVVGRLRELEPLVAEYEELRRAAERLGVDYQPQAQLSAAATPRRRRSTSTRPAPAKRARRSGPVGRRAEQVMEAVRSKPGITVPEVGQQL